MSYLSFKIGMKCDGCGEQSFFHYIESFESNEVGLVRHHCECENYTEKELKRVHGKDFKPSKPRVFIVEEE